MARLTSQPKSIPPAPAPALALHTPPRLLVIDDASAIHEDFHKILAEGDWPGMEAAEAALFGQAPAVPERVLFQLDSAHQGQEGLALVQQALAQGRPYALAFVDIRMPPGWDGIETTAKLWEVDPDLQIVLCTAYTDYSWEEIAQRLGNTDSLLILKKPFETAEVLQLAHALSKKWRLTRQVQSQLHNLDNLVSERTRELRAAQEHLHHLVSHNPAVIYSHKTDGQTLTPTWISDNILQVTGYTPAEACQPEWWSSQVHPADWEQAAAPGFRLPQDQAAAEYRVRHKLGDYRWVRDERRLVRNAQGQPVEVLGSWMDITQRKELEERYRQAQKMEAIGQLAGGVAHDFNNLLLVIQGNAELLLLDAEQYSSHLTDCLQQITAAAQRAANLTRQLLAFSRKQVLQPQPLHLNEVVANLTKMLQRIIGEHIQLHCQYAPQLPLVHADTGMLEQVLVNLVVNARDAMPQGGQLRIATQEMSFSAQAARASREARAGSFVCLSVTDTGAGIAPEHLPHIFEPFFTTKEVGKGTGLGLATAYGIIKQHQGWIDVSSEPGAGSTFQVFLPAQLLPGSLLAEAAVETPVRGGTETILLVEDDSAVRMLTRRLLENFGYRVHEAACGREALDQWRTQLAALDLVLTDMIMPQGISGRELVEHLRAQRPELRVVFLSGYTADVVGKDTGLFRQARTRFLQKPCSWKDLLLSVRQCLDERSA